MLLLEKAGFEITAEYGGFDFDAWHPGADKWIVESVKELVREFKRLTISSPEPEN